uniref:lysophospholipid acyltransferase family protein n=1 Tax=uncultured Lutibacter sp. TaxID=437739 RepID=UPI00262F580A
YYIIFYVIGYRKKVVMYNLTITFPEKSKEELITIQKKFYKHFVDVFIEMIKSFTISKEEVYKRYTYTNIDFFTELYKDGKSVSLTGPHYANWEWIMSLDSFVDYKGYAAYTRVNNPYLNKKILDSRAKFGTNLIPTAKILSEIKYNSEHKIQAMYGLLSDQSPQLKKTHYWNHFLAVKVPIHTGAEMLAKKFNMNMVYIATKKIKRGYYETSFSLISNDASKYPDYQLTDIFLEKVEKQIRNQPEYYFWTHKRFKHKDKAPKN